MRESEGLHSHKDRSRELMESSEVRREEREPPGPSNAPPPKDGGSIWDRVMEASTIAPIHGDPGLEPVDNPWELAMMAGWGDPEERGRGHDALGGVEDLLLGKVDAREELKVSLGDGGDPLKLEPEERMSEKIDNGFDLGHDEQYDWCSHL